MTRARHLNCLAFMNGLRSEVAMVTGALACLEPSTAVEAHGRIRNTEIHRKTSPADISYMSLSHYDTAWTIDPGCDGCHQKVVGGIASKCEYPNYRPSRRTQGVR
jgi:hypothetical protein